MKRKIEIIPSPHAGYCFGVKRAMRLIEQGLETFGPPIYTLGDVIHNPPEVERLRKRGVLTVNSLDEVPAGGTLVLRAHGIHPSLILEAKRRRVHILDATCPFVRRSQDFARHMNDEGYRVIIIGDREHPEVQAVAGHAGEAPIVVRNTEEALAVPPFERAGVVIQTTFSRPEAERVIEALRRTVVNLRVQDTICEATEARRAAALDLAKRVDLMLVIGGRNSSNTKRLFQACIDAGVPARFVESVDDLADEWFSGVRRIGLTTGTSTPHWLIEEILAKLRAISDPESGGRGAPA